MLLSHGHAHPTGARSCAARTATQCHKSRGCARTPLPPDGQTWDSARGAVPRVCSTRRSYWAAVSRLAVCGSLLHESADCGCGLLRGDACRVDDQVIEHGIVPRCLVETLQVLSAVLVTRVHL